MIDITKNPPSSDEIEMRKRNDRVVILAISVIFVVFLVTSMFNSSSWIFCILFAVVSVNLYAVFKKRFEKLTPITPEQTEYLLDLLCVADAECLSYHRKVCDLEREYVKGEYEMLKKRLVGLHEERLRKALLSQYKECLY